MPQAVAAILSLEFNNYKFWDLVYKELPHEVEAIQNAARAIPYALWFREPQSDIYFPDILALIQQLKQHTASTNQIIDIIKQCAPEPSGMHWLDEYKEGANTINSVVNPPPSPPNGPNGTNDPSGQNDDPSNDPDPLLIDLLIHSRSLVFVEQDKAKSANSKLEPEPSASLFLKMLGGLMMGVGALALIVVAMAKLSFTSTVLVAGAGIALGLGGHSLFSSVSASDSQKQEAEHVSHGLS